MKEGDTLIVPELSRLAGSVGQAVMIVDELIKKKVSFICLKEDIKLIDGEKDVKATVMLTLFSLFAAIERVLAQLPQSADKSALFMRVSFFFSHYIPSRAKS